eukprot:1541050-Rhodomonas_salina.1
MSGTGPARNAMTLRACYAMSGTEFANGSMALRAWYAMSGTELAYGATSGCGCAGSPARAVRQTALCARAYDPMHRHGTEIAYERKVAYARRRGTETAYQDSRVKGGASAQDDPAFKRQVRPA